MAGPDLPRALTNQAVAATRVFGKPRVYASLGLAAPRHSGALVRDHWMLDPASGRWKWRTPVPGQQGRLAATAQAIRGRIYVVGGYTVAASGIERSLPTVDVYDPKTSRWSRAAAMPRPVDDAVSAVWRNRYLVLVSGWHQTGTVRDVSLLDTKTDTWISATPTPGPAVFGHAGGIVGDTIVYCDGVAMGPATPRFAMTAGCFRGELDRRHVGRITWTRIEHHPGLPRYRTAVGRLPRAPILVFAGGSVTPYNYDGIGYSGEAARPTADVYGYDVPGDRWITLAPLPEPRMDLRGLAAADDGLWLVGGMGPDQEVSPSTFVLRRAAR